MTGTRGHGRPFSPVSTRTMTDIEAAYVGAMIDTDGSAFWHRDPRSGREYPSFNFVNCEPELISAMFRLTGTGTITTFWPGGIGHRRWLWRLNRTMSVLDLAKQIEPYSIKAQRLLTEVKKGHTAKKVK